MKPTITRIPPAPVIVLPTDTDPKTVAAAKQAGYLAILSDTPEKIRIVHADTDVTGGTLLMAALHGLASDKMDDRSRSAFAYELHRRMLSKEAQK